MLNGENHCGDMALQSLCTRKIRILVGGEGRMNPYHQKFNLWNLERHPLSPQVDFNKGGGPCRVYSHCTGFVHGGGLAGRGGPLSESTPLTEKVPPGAWAAFWELHSSGVAAGFHQQSWYVVPQLWDRVLWRVCAKFKGRLAYHWTLRRGRNHG